MAKSNLQNKRDVVDGLFDLDEPCLVICNLARGIRMLATSDDMPQDVRGAVYTVADELVNKVEALCEERSRLHAMAMREHEASGGVAAIAA